MEAQILDPCCGSKMFWFDKNNENVLFADIRKEDHILCDGRKLHISPDKILDFRKMPFEDGQFKLIVFDPPHLKQLGETSWMIKEYGKLNKQTWQTDLSKGFDECWRCLNTCGTLIFKWNETQIKLKDVLNCFSQSPLFGHTTTHNLKTHWMVFFKEEKESE